MQWGEGPVGDAVRASEGGRLRRFVRDEESEPVALFSAKAREVSDSGDWYGEHLGKWLVAASAAWHRTEDPELARTISRIVGHMVDCQEANGYLGTYGAGAPCRFTHADAAKVRTWDIWVHAWMILGLLKAAAVPGAEEGLVLAVAAGELILETFPQVHPTVVALGNHAGLSSSVILEPLAELTRETGDGRYADLAMATLEEMERRGLHFLSAPERNLDVSDIGTGKAYQICWTITGMVALYRATADPRLLRSAEALWENIEGEHLTPMGGPWGGTATHKEVFNVRGFFSPYGMVETCSAASWMSLSKALFGATGKARYVDAYERTLLNTVLGALDANGEDWCYFTFPNGRRNNTYHWACCKSSGAMALEEAASMVATLTDNGISVNLLLPSRIELGPWTIRVVDRHGSSGFSLPGIHPEGVSEISPGFPTRGSEAGPNRPRSGSQNPQSIGIENAPEGEATLALRLPNGARLKSCLLNGETVDVEPTDGYLTWTRTWTAGDRIELELDCPIEVHPKTYTVDHHGQEIVRMDYAYLSRGPYVYATGAIDGFRKEETLRLARLNPAASFRSAEGEAIDLHLPGRDPLRFLPYYEAGGRHEGAWRTTWLQVAWQ
ncbi:beta-L-arabinofuranosidase domain-containing protein [Fimbriimonas ginsengisoli]|uniref:Glycoside hydrolase family 127 protein n=1 Tax=Fimbriimonas ginsengisoli Gsoil 348 TaxID=661478 RepID=A0A068NQ63_FIMGI|nr:beta-L-arabinofuranosidase domain-containing protein [Fimbriimonas ginsengisoli]AIE83754.1 hypothetical protein OP10G_0386 [Fimbriimonas ginsengisoli Gsoil 348]